MIGKPTRVVLTRTNRKMITPDIEVPRQLAMIELSLNRARNDLPLEWKRGHAIRPTVVLTVDDMEWVDKCGLVDGFQLGYESYHLRTTPSWGKFGSGLVNKRLGETAKKKFTMRIELKLEEGYHVETLVQVRIHVAPAPMDRSVERLMYA